MRTALVLLLAGALFAQDRPLARLAEESAVLKAYPEDQRDGDAFASQLKRMHRALRDWIESRLPQTAAPLGDLKDLEATLQKELKEAGLGAQVAFHWLPELYDTLFVIAGANVECGADQAIYMYHWESRGRTRVFEDHPANRLQFESAAMDISDADSEGRRLLVTHYTTVQCESTWMVTAYSVYRLAARNDAAERLLAGEHDFWLNGDGPEFVLKPDQLILQFLDSSLDPGIHNRTEIQRYSFAAGVRRLDPVALQPQDFAEEWLTRPWSEMQSRSAPETEEWHNRLHADTLFAEYDSVLPCAARPGRWLVRLDIDRVGQQRMEYPAETWFLVRDLGDFHYRMESVGATRPAGCPGAGIYANSGNASDKHPWLSEAELKALK